MHNQYVMNNCPKDKLLVWRIEEGWEPICKFLGKPVPDGPLPHMNRLGGVIQELANSVDYQVLAFLRAKICNLFFRRWFANKRFPCFYEWASSLESPTAGSKD